MRGLVAERLFLLTGFLADWAGLEDADLGAGGALVLRWRLLLRCRPPFFRGLLVLLCEYSRSFRGPV